MNAVIEIKGLDSRLETIEKTLSFIQASLSSITSQKDQSTDLIRIKEAAKLVNLQVATIYTLVSQSEIPVHKRGKLLWFSKTELVEWIKSGRRKTIGELSNEADNYLKKKQAHN